MRSDNFIQMHRACKLLFMCFAKDTHVIGLFFLIHAQIFLHKSHEN